MLESLDLNSTLPEEQLVQRVSADIETYLAMRGYYAPHIGCTLPPPKKPALWQRLRTPKKQLYCLIRYGEPLRIHSINVQLQGPGQANAALLNLLKNCPLKVGMRFEEAHYESYKQQLLTTALDEGYLEAAFLESQVLVEPRDYQANIRLRLETAKAFSFGPVSFPQAPYPPTYLKRYIPFETSDPYRTETLFKLQRNLLESDLFQQVRVEPEPQTQTARVPLKVMLDPKPRNHYTFGLGFGTDTGLRERIQWERRRATLPGHKIELGAKASERANQGRMLYSMPLNQSLGDRLSFGTQIVEEKPSDRKYSLRHETSLSALQKTDTRERTLSMRYLSESFRALRNTPKQQSHFLIPQLAYLWIHKEPSASASPHPSLNIQGFRLSIKVQGGLEKLGSSTNIIRAETRLKAIKTLFESTRLIIRGDVGATQARDHQKIPLSLRFFTGGDQTVRGFGYQSLGPTEKDPLGNTVVIGGRYLIVGSVELEKMLYKKIGVALFSDAGNAMNRLDQPLFYSAGFGLRYATALGAVRVDIAQPLLKGRKPRLHLNFGMDF